MTNYTEQESLHQNLENQSIESLLHAMNEEDQKVPDAVKAAIPQILPLVDCVVNCLSSGGRLFYIGAGTSGRLGVVDASECPPTFGVSHDMVTALIAGGDQAIRKAVEHAEDNDNQGWKDVLRAGIQKHDVLVGIASSGSTLYVVSALKEAQLHDVYTACITCNTNTPVAAVSHYPVEVLVGPEFVTGSTRLKSGTAQKLVLNMISTVSMIKLGRVQGNRMVDMQLSNEKLIARGVQMILLATTLTAEQAKTELLRLGSVREVIDLYKLNN